MSSSTTNPSSSSTTASPSTSMSFTPPSQAPSLTSSASASSTSAAADINPPSSNGSLYLYTFLATLVLLLAISSTIVARSLVLRRRHRRLIEEAIRNGTWVPPPQGSRSRRDIGEKPVMWDAWVVGADKTGDEDLTPLAARYIKDDAPPPSDTKATPPTQDASVPRRAAILPWRRRPETPTPAASAPVPEETDASPQQIRVSVLIAMPTPTPLPAASEHAEEREIPVLEFGVCELGLRN
ncbi:hypothetical protein PLICRDRAFT_46979 [Plicaturopsis crispa FD-325 SS-3]|uniref:Uncharacterized protein n=1 Tax=Plicaturopsis crispa FD-325 SS-3 TaxID=944288 RepID=A0A0C9T6S5_PLICR|nr:hypothetical protein PLICRDRAFT_46979 [Plicaturopsis crispa FD-325 SS-3]